MWLKCRETNCFVGYFVCVNYYEPLVIFEIKCWYYVFVALWSIKTDTLLVTSSHIDMCWRRLTWMSRINGDNILIRWMGVGLTYNCVYYTCVPLPWTDISVVVCLRVLMGVIASQSLSPCVSVCVRVIQGLVQLNCQFQLHTIIKTQR